MLFHTDQIKPTSNEEYPLTEKAHAIDGMKAEEVLRTLESTERNCRVYKDRPLGCRLHPVVYLADEGVTVDDLCPMGHTVSERELRKKGKILVKLLKKIDSERKSEYNPCKLC